MTTKWRQWKRPGMGKWKITLHYITFSQPSTKLRKMIFGVQKRWLNTNDENFSTEIEGVMDIGRHCKTKLMIQFHLIFTFDEHF